MAFEDLKLAPGQTDVPIEERSVSGRLPIEEVDAPGRAWNSKDGRMGDRSPRIRTRFETLFCSQRQEGEGILIDLSYTGARLEGAATKPNLGVQAILHVCLPTHSEPFELVGKVVRHTETGFAIQFENPDPYLFRWVDQVARIVAIPEESPSGPTPSRSAVEESPVQTGGPEMPRLRGLDLEAYDVPELEALIERAAAELAQRRQPARRRAGEEMGGGSPSERGSRSMK